MASANASAKTSPRSLEEIHHISHSSRELWARCSKSWFLKYLARAPKTPALWSAGGSAVHEVTEAWDRRAVHPEALATMGFDVEAHWSIHFAHQLKAAREAEPNENIWKRSKTEGIAEWNAQGPQFVQAWIDWRKRSNYEVWTTPEGEPAIELEVSGYLPGCEVEIKAYVDRVFYEPVLKRYDVIDIKTGKKPPSGPEQFVVYAALLKQKYGLDTALGVPFMNRPGSPATPHDLTGVDPAEVGAAFQEAWEDIQEGIFEPDTTGRACFICDVSASCYWKNGPLAAQYDPLHPDHPGYTGRETPPF